MKRFNFFFLASLLSLVIACGPADSYESYATMHAYAPLDADMNVQDDGFGESGVQARFASNKPTNDEVIMHPVKDPKTGRNSFYIPLPASWKLSPQGWQGPEGSVVKEQVGGNFNSMQGGILSADQIVQQRVLPTLQQSGFQVLNTSHLPQVAQADQRILQQYWSSTPTQKTCEARGIAYTDQQGNKGLVVLHLFNYRSQAGQFGYFYFHVMNAQPQRYEQTKQEVLYALSNYRIDPQHLAAYNQREQQKSSASWAAHNSRMRSRHQQFSSWQKTQDTYNEIGDIYMDGWKSRNQSSDRMQDMSVNGIWEREAVTNPYTGEQGTVQSGYDNYYMNQWNEYIGTDDQFYNPNMDPSVNNQDWQRIQNPNY